MTPLRLDRAALMTTAEQMLWRLVNSGNYDEAVAALVVRVGPERVLELAQRIRSASHRDDALERAALSGRLPPECSLAVAESIGESGRRATVLLQLVVGERLPPELVATAAFGAVASAGAIADPHLRASTLALFASVWQFPADLVAFATRRATQFARELTDPQQRADVLLRLPVPAIDEAFEAAQLIDDLGERACTLARMTSPARFPAGLAKRAAGLVLEALRTIDSPKLRAEILFAVAGVNGVSAALRSQATEALIEIVQTLSHRTVRADTLVRLGATADAESVFAILTAEQTLAQIEGTTESQRLEWLEPVIASEMLPDEVRARACALAIAAARAGVYPEILALLDMAQRVRHPALIQFATEELHRASSIDDPLRRNNRYLAILLVAGLPDVLADEAETRFLADLPHYTALVERIRRLLCAMRHRGSQQLVAALLDELPLAGGLDSETSASLLCDYAQVNEIPAVDVAAASLLMLDRTQQQRVWLALLPRTSVESGLRVVGQIEWPYERFLGLIHLADRLAEEAP